MKIKLKQEHSEMLKTLGNVSTSSSTGIKKYFIAQSFINEPGEEDIYTEKYLSDMSKDELRELGIQNIFTLQDMKDCFAAGVNTSKSVNDNLFTFEDYIKGK